eukprot:scaffold3534_cov102-Cylindrotheca_fusiformis.AAC.1
MDYSYNWWYQATEERSRYAKVWAFTSSLWPLTLNIVPEIIRRGYKELARRVQTEFPAEQVIAELNAQERDIVLSAVAVREALYLRIKDFEEDLDPRYNPNPLRIMKNCKPGIDRLLDLLDIHRQALTITRQLRIKAAVDAYYGGETLDFRFYCFEEHPIGCELEDKYRRVYEYYGNRMLRGVGTDYRLYSHIGFPPVHPLFDLGRACCIDFSASRNGFLLHMIDRDRFKFVTDDMPYYLTKRGARASVGESLIAEGLWTGASVWDPVPQPRYPEEERRTPNWNRQRLVEAVGGIASPPLRTPTPLPSAYSSFSEYVATLSPAVRSLFADLDLRIPDDELVETLNNTSQQPQFKCVGVSDGSALADSMTFGWTLAAPDGFRMVACAGPAYGSQASSYRAEGYGFVSMAMFLFHFRHFCEAIPDWKVTFVSDNLGLVTKVSQSWHYDFPFPNLTLAPDYDIVHETVMLLRQARVRATFSHVKGHQDSTSKPFDSLPLVAQLNIEADDLAGEYRRLHDNESHSKVPLLSHTRCILHLNDHDSITRSYTTVLRTHVATPALRNYMLRRFHWTLKVFHSIDWTLFNRCRQKLLSAHRQIIKFGFDILPTSAIVARSNPALSATCPLCSLSPETNAHLYQCSHAAVRSWRSSVLAELRALLDKWDTKYGLVEILMAGLGTVFDPASGDTIDVTPFPPSLHPLIVRSQNSIGWHHLLSGRASVQWAPLQHEVYAARPVPPPPALSGASWLTEVLHFLMSK